MTTTYDVCVIGSGAAGLTIAGGAALYGVKTCLIEAGAMGGDCLNNGCVPSNALIAAARAVHTTKTSQTLFERGAASLADLPPSLRQAMEKVSLAIATIAPHDSVERFEAMGCTVIKGFAKFRDRKSIEVDGTVIRARHFVLATGSKPHLPDGLGLEDIVTFTPENIWMLRDCPDHLLILGGGTVSVEIGQAFKRLGANVTIIEHHHILGSEDEDAVAIMRQQLEEDGINLFEKTELVFCRQKGAKISAQLRTPDGFESDINADAILVATGRSARTKGMNLEKAGVHTDRGGIIVNKHLKTTNPNIYAIGDARGAPNATNLAGHDAIAVLKRILFKLPAKPHHHQVPRVLNAVPELAQVGLTAKAAKARYGNRVKVIEVPFAENDRAICESAPQGFGRIIPKGFGRIMILGTKKLVGATIIGNGAGELILPWTLALKGKLSLKDLAETDYPYPVRSELTKELAFRALQEKTFSPALKSLAKLLVRL